MTIGTPHRRRPKTAADGCFLKNWILAPRTQDDCTRLQGTPPAPNVPVSAGVMIKKEEHSTRTL